MYGLHQPTGGLIGQVCIFIIWVLVSGHPGAVSASEMTYIVSGGALNSTYSLTLAPADIQSSDQSELLQWFWQPIDNSNMNIVLFVCFCFFVLSVHQFFWQKNNLARFQHTGWSKYSLTLKGFVVHTGWPKK